MPSPTPPTHEEFKRAIETFRFFFQHAESLFHTYSLLDLHLFEGVERASAPFITRLVDEHPEEKRAIAKGAVEHYHRNLNAAADIGTALNPPKYFYESGSVVAYIVGALAHELSQRTSDSPRMSALTNNLAALTALAGLVPDVRCIKGRFDPKYYALLPFAEEPTPTQLVKETHEFHALVSEVKQCDYVFAACSSFSFIYGPLVGTRANALSKRAILDVPLHWPSNTRAEKKVVLAFQVQKLVPLTHEAGNTRFAMRSHGHGCYGIFAPPREAEREVMGRRWVQLLDFAKHGFAGFSGHLEWHENRLSKGESPTTAVEAFGAAYKDPDAHRNRPSLDTTWLQIARFVELLIGLPNDGQLERAILEKELQLANELLVSLKSPYRYRSEERGNVVIVTFVDDRPPKAPAKR